jgi:UDP-glucose 4-epimerase
VIRLPVWVVGRGGFLGSHVVHAVRRANDLELWERGQRFSWSDPATLARELEGAIDDFLAFVSGRRFSILWCAGAGVIGTSSETLRAESANLAGFLARLGARLQSGGEGSVFLAGSAGGVYGGSVERPLSESSPCRPISDYGREKLKQEELLLAWAEGHRRISALVGRISNLYGPGQNLSKPQGIMSRLAWSFIYKRPIHLWVSLDNVRDYLYVEDCASQIVQATRWLAAREEPTRGIKILASEQEASLATVLAVFRRVARHSPRAISVRKEVSSQQPAGLSFRSRVEPKLPRAETSLPVGVHRVYRNLVERYLAGALGPPP